MVCKRKNIIRRLQLTVTAFMTLLILQLPVHNIYAQEEKVATIQLSFSATDSTKICKATVLSDSMPVKGTEVHLYVKSLYSLLPVGKVVETDENGEANISFPMDLPGGKGGMLTIIAKIEHDDTYGDVETQAEMKWGVLPKNEYYNWNTRSLAASREKAPMFLVIASNLIIGIIWGTIFFVIIQLFRIRRSGRLVKKMNSIKN